MKVIIILIAVFIVVFDVVDGIGKIYATVKFTDINGAAGDYFGQAVAIHRDTVVIGSPNDEEHGKTLIGSINIYSFNGTALNLKKKITPSDGQRSDFFGRSVSLNTDYIVVGETGRGSAYIYRYNGSAWLYTKIAPAPPAGDYLFGKSVGINNINEIVVGSPLEDYKGAAFTFSYDGSEWIKRQQLVPPDLNTDSNFGFSVAITNTHIAVGAYKQNYNKVVGSGSVYIYKKTTVWLQHMQLGSPRPQKNGYFGYSIGIYDERIVVGAHYEDSETGNAYVYVKDGGIWKLEATLKSSDGPKGQQFGYSVSISQSIIIIGAPFTYDKRTITVSGRAYAFKLMNRKWREYGKLVAGDGKLGDYFGCSVSMFNDSKVVVGSYGNDAKGSMSGAAYLYNGLNVVSSSNRITGICHQLCVCLFVSFMYLLFV